MKHRKKLVIGIAAMLFLATINPALTSDVLPLRELWSTEVKDNITFRTAVGDVNGDGRDDLAVMPVDKLQTDVTYNTLQILKGDGSLLWEKSLKVDMATVAVKDINLDGKGEVFVCGVLTDYKYIIYALSHEGNLLWEFEKSGEYHCSLPNLLFLNLDEDRELEIFVILDAVNLSLLSFDKYTFVALDTNGSQIWSFETEASRNFGKVCDVNNDGNEEIVVVSSGGTYEDPLYGEIEVAARVYVLTKTGNTLWKYGCRYGQSSGEFFISTDDITGDQINEIVIAASSVVNGFRSKLYVLKGDGTLLWDKDYYAQEGEKPKTITNPLLIDVNGDMKKDVVIYGRSKIYCYRNDGTELWTFDGKDIFKPDVWQYYYILTSLDVNQDGKDEVIFESEGVYSLSGDGKELRKYGLPSGSSLTWMTPVEGWTTGRGIHGITMMNVDINDESFKAFIILKIPDRRIYVSAVAIGAVLQKTNMELSIIDKEKWYTNLDVPFNIPEAEEYVETVKTSGILTEKPFGNASVNIEVKNTGDQVAQNVIMTTSISGSVILIKLNEKNKFMDLLFPYHEFEDYSITQSIGTVNSKNTTLAQAIIPIKYMSVIVGVIPYITKENIDMSMKILITIVQLDVKVKITGDNFNSIEQSTKIYGISDPKHLLEQWNEALRERVKHLQQKALEDLLKKQLSTLGNNFATRIYSDIGIGLHRIITPVKIPEAAMLIVSVALPIGVTLSQFSVNIGSITAAETGIINGFGLIIIEGMDELLPQGEITAEININTEQKSGIIGVAHTIQQNNEITLAITNITLPKFFSFHWEDRIRVFGISSNATITGCELNENERIIRLNISSSPSCVSYYKITVPTDVVGENIEVWIDSNRIQDFEITKTSEYANVYFTYNCQSGICHIEIIPEFPIVMFLLFFFALTLALMTQQKKMIRMNRDNKDNT